jgi:predicted  nucleic acid-binding Zn-ribbon protein
MSCKQCGKLIQKGERFVLVGIYPSKFKKFTYHDWFDGPEYFREVYHEACYLKHLANQESKKKESV